MKFRTMVLIGGLAYGAYKAYRESQKSERVRQLDGGRSTAGGI